MIAEVSIRRVDPDGGERWERYRVPCEPTDRVAQALEYIREHLDGSLAYRPCFCKRGSCGLCMMEVNGRVVKACKTPVQPVMRIAPLPRPVIRDMVVSFKE